MVNDEIVEIILNNDVSKLKNFINDTKTDLSKANFFIENFENHALSNRQLTLLHVAACSDSLDCFIYILEHVNGLNLKSVTSNSYYPLHYACCLGSFEVASYILSQMPELAKEEPEGCEHQFLYFAIIGGDPDIIQLLFDHGADMKTRGNIKDNLLPKATYCRKISCLEVLLKNYHDIKKERSKHSLPMLAVINQLPDALMLLANNAFDILYMNDEYESVFSLCAFFGLTFKKPLLKLLKMVEGCRIEPPDGAPCKSVCHWICQLHDLDIAKAMLKTKDVNLNRFDNNGLPGIAQLIDLNDCNENDTIDLILYLISNGLDINARAPPINGVYRTPSILEKFVFAARKDKKIIRFLIDNGADIYAPKSNTKQPLVDYVLKRISNKDIINIFNQKLQSIQ